MESKYVQEGTHAENASCSVVIEELSGDRRAAEDEEYLNSGDPGHIRGRVMP
jgi:hypothetical protein